MLHAITTACRSTNTQLEQQFIACKVLDTQRSLQIYTAADGWRPRQGKPFMSCCCWSPGVLVPRPVSQPPPACSICWPGGLSSCRRRLLLPHDFFDGNDVVRLVDAVCAVVHDYDFDLVPVLQHLELLQVLHQLRRQAREGWCADVAVMAQAPMQQFLGAAL